MERRIFMKIYVNKKFASNSWNFFGILLFFCKFLQIELKKNSLTLGKILIFIKGVKIYEKKNKKSHLFFFFQLIEQYFTSSHQQKSANALSSQ